MTLVLCNVSLLTVPLAEVIPAAGDAGFDAVSVLARSHARAVRDGMTTADVRALADDHGVRITDVEASGDWLGVEPDDVPERLRTIVASTDALLETASELGATTLTAVHAGEPRPLDEAGAAFAHLCDRGAEFGLQVALEFVPWMGIRSLAEAWDIVRTADRPNGGVLVDVWHHRRSHGDDRLLADIPPERVLSVQLCDADAEASGPLTEDVTRRTLPGRGELDVVEFVRALLASGVDAPFGVEAFDADLVAQGAQAAARVLHDELAAVVDAARRGG